MSNVERSKCNGGCWEMRSDGAISKYLPAHLRNCTTLAWVIITPLGSPVDPDVNRTCATSPSVLAHAGGVAGYTARARQVNAGAASAAGTILSSSHPIAGRPSKGA